MSQATEIVNPPEWTLFKIGISSSLIGPILGLLVYFWTRSIIILLVDWSRSIGLSDLLGKRVLLKTENSCHYRRRYASLLPIQETKVRFVERDGFLLRSIREY